MRHIGCLRIDVRAFIIGYRRALDAWTLAHRLCALTLVAALTLSAGLYLRPTENAIELRTQRVAIETLNARIQHIQAAAESVTPQRTTRQRLAAIPDDATLLKMFSPALDIADLKLDAFEPGEFTITSNWHERRVQLRVSGSFAALIKFIARLATLPLPVVPATAQLRAQANRRLLSASVRVIGIIGMRTADRLPQTQQKTIQAQNPLLPDPFARAGSAQIETEAGAPQFIGVLQRGRARAALVQSPAGIQLLRVGDLFEGTTVTRIDDISLSLSDGAAVQRTLLLRAPNSAPQTLPQLEHFSVRLPQEQARKQYRNRYGRSRSPSRSDGGDPAARPSSEREAIPGKPLKNALRRRAKP